MEMKKVLFEMIDSNRVCNYEMKLRRCGATKFPLLAHYEAIPNVVPEQTQQAI